MKVVKEVLDFLKSLMEFLVVAYSLHKTIKGNFKRKKSPKKKRRK